MIPEDLPHLPVLQRGPLPERVFEIAEVSFIGGRKETLYVLGIQADRRPDTWNLVHTLSFDKSFKILDYAGIRNAMLEEVERYDVQRR